MNSPLKVMVVEDSLTAQKLIVSILSKDPNIDVIGVASSGEEAIRLLENLEPDVITMDIHMPGMNGLDVTRKIMETRPVPIVVVSESCLVHDVERAFQLIDAGALSAIPKPVPTPGLSATGRSKEFEIAAGRLTQTVKDMSQVKVVRRWPRLRKPDEPGQAISTSRLTRLPKAEQLSVIALGASTGGPAALCEVLKGLPANYPLPIVAVQHIAPGFLAGMVEWMNQSLKVKVKVAAAGEVLKAGHLYIAPEGRHLALQKAASNIAIALDDGPPKRGHRPAVSHLFASLADDFGPSALGILLTGMGQDGASELLRMKEAGATTIAQDKESSVVHGMPGEAIRLGGAVHVLSLEAIAEVLLYIGREIQK